MTAAPERGIWLVGSADRNDLRTFAELAVRLDEAAVVRLRTRTDDSVSVWAATGFDVLATRSFGGRVVPADLAAAADTLVAALSAGAGGGYVDPGFPMDSGWRSTLPPTGGFTHVDDVPAGVLLELAGRGADLARESGAAPTSLLDQNVIDVGSADGALTVGVPMRCIFAMTAMGFLPKRAEDGPADEVVRVRASSGWLRIDARFGSVYYRRAGGGPNLFVGH